MGIDLTEKAPLSEEALMTAALRLDVPELADLLERRDLTVDDVARLPEDLRYELIDGRLVLTLSPSYFHQRVMLDVTMACRVNEPPDIGISHDQSVMIDNHNERRPDVVAIRIEGASVSPVASVDLILAVEILSPSSQRVDRKDKLKVYADAGVAHYWIIDPLAERMTLTEFVLGQDGRYQQVRHTDERATLDRPWRVTLDLPAFTADRDRILRRARRMP